MISLSEEDWIEGIFSNTYLQKRHAARSTNSNCLHFIDVGYNNKNKMPTNWWGRQNDAPLKFDPKPSEAAYFRPFFALR